MHCGEAVGPGQRLLSAAASLIHKTLLCDLSRSGAGLGRPTAAIASPSTAQT
jgi:hypothetical protein